MPDRSIVVMGTFVAALALHTPAQGAQLASVEPRIAAPGDEVEIRGEGFGDRPGRWQLTMSRIVDHRPQRREMLILDWADRRIRALVPPQAPSDGYLLLLSWRDRATVHSNTIVLHVAGPDDRGDAHYSANDEYERAAIAERRDRGSSAHHPPAVPWLDSVEPRTVRPGDTLRLKGRGFGAAPADRVVAINLGRIREASVLSWRESEVQVRVPRDLEPGEYRVLVYLDRRYVYSSNTVPVRVR